MTSIAANVCHHVYFPYTLHYNYYQYNYIFLGQIPVVPLNFTVLSNETPFNRDTVETCIHEVIQAMSRLLASKGNIQLEFSGIGRLFIRESKVKMRFFQEFITQLDSSGEMESAFRPGTAQTELSIMSDPTPTRLGTQSLVLPRIIETSGSGNSLSLELSSPLPQSVGDTEDDVTSIKSDDTDKESTVKRKSPPLLTETKNGEVVLDPTITESGKQSAVNPRNISSSESRRLVPKPATLFVGHNSTGTQGQLQTQLTNSDPSKTSSSPRPASASKIEKATAAASNQTKNATTQSRFCLLDQVKSA